MKKKKQSRKENNHNSAYLYTALILPNTKKRSIIKIWSQNEIKSYKKWFF